MGVEVNDYQLKCGSLVVGDGTDFRLLEVAGLGTPAVQDKVIPYQGSIGSTVRRRFSGKVVTVKLHVKSSSKALFNARIKELQDNFQSREETRIYMQFPEYANGTEVTALCLPSLKLELKHEVTYSSALVTVTLLIPGGRTFTNVERMETFSSGTRTLTNDGNAPTVWQAYETSTSSNVPLTIDFTLSYTTVDPVAMAQQPITVSEVVGLQLQGYAGSSSVRIVFDSEVRTAGTVASSMTDTGGKPIISPLFWTSEPMTIGSYWLDIPVGSSTLTLAQTGSAQTMRVVYRDAWL